jgi:hypothetical protein
MQILKFFLDWGKHGLGALWLPYLIVMAILGYQVYQAHKSEYGNYDVKGQWVKISDTTPLLKINQFKGMIVLTVIAIIIHFSVQASYK